MHLSNIYRTDPWFPKLKSCGRNYYQKSTSRHRPILNGNRGCYLTDFQSLNRLFHWFLCDLNSRSHLNVSNLAIWRRLKTEHHWIHNIFNIECSCCNSSHFFAILFIFTNCIEEISCNKTRWYLVCTNLIFMIESIGWNGVTCEFIARSSWRVASVRAVTAYLVTV